MRSTVKLFSDVGLALALLVILAEGARAQTQLSGNGLKANVGIRANVTRTGDRSGGTYIGDDMLPGGSSRFNVAVGNGNDLCYSSVWPSEAAPPPAAAQAHADKQEASAHYVWRFDVRMLEVGTDRIKFDITWERASRVMPGELLRRTQQLTLREGESRPIDLLHGRPGSDCINVVLEVTAGVVEDPVRQDKTLEWDLWLSGGAQTEPVHRALSSPQGESAAFQFDPVTATSVSLSGEAQTVSVEVYGQLRGRVRPDGSIDVAFNTNRSVRFDLGSQPTATTPKPLSRAGGSGQKNFTLKAGEAVRIVLPPLGPSGRVQFRTDPVTGEQKATIVPGTQSSVPSASQMWITVQARVR